MSRAKIAGALALVMAAALWKRKQANQEPEFTYYRVSSGEKSSPDRLTGAVDGLLSILGVLGRENSSQAPDTPQIGYATPNFGSPSSLLNLIGGAEGGRDGYNAIYGGIRASDRPSKPITQMTVAQVLAWQDRIDPYYRSEAVGRYQVMEDTLRGLVNKGAVSKNAIFNAATQDKIAVLLLEGRGLDDYRRGDISASQLANNIAKEWAGLPVVTGPNAGRSYYDGFNGNSATTTVSKVLNAITEMV